MGNSTINASAKKEFHTIHQRPFLFLAFGLICYCTSLILSFYHTSIISSTIFTQIGFIAGRLADHLWSTPSALAVLFISASLVWFFYRNKPREKGVPYLSVALFFLLFLYTLFPLNWAQHNLARSLDSFPDQSPLDGLIQILNIAGTIFCCLYCFIKLPSTIVALLENATSHFFKLKESFFICSLLMLCLVSTAIIAYTVLDHIPHVQDSIAQLFQAKIFKMGELYASLPPHKEFFDYTNVINVDRWYSQYPPGHAFIMTVGLFLEAPWLIGPLLGTLSLFVFFLIVKTLYRDHRITYLSCSILLLSPFFLFMSSSFMNHTTTMFFLLLSLYFYLRMFSSQSCLSAVISGLSLGYAINVRPLTAAAVGAPFICYALYCAWYKKEIHSKHLVSLFSALSFMVVLLLLYNYLTTGHPLLFGYQQNYHTLGFLGSAQVGPPHTLKGGVINTSNNLIGLNRYLFEWPFPSLIFVFVFLLLPVNKNRWEYLFLYSSITLVMSYFFYYYQDLCFGPRFYFSLTPLLIILTVRGFLELPVWLEGKGFDRRTTEASLYLLLLCAFLYTFSYSLPSLINKYSDDYRWVTDKIHNEVKAQEIKNAIVFIDVWHPRNISNPNLIPYASGFQFNSPDLSDEVIYAMDLKEKNSTLMDAFPHRDYYLCKIHKPMSDFTLIKIDKKPAFTESNP